MAFICAVDREPRIEDNKTRPVAVVPYAETLPLSPSRQRGGSPSAKKPDGKPATAHDQEQQHNVPPLSVIATIVFFPAHRGHLITISVP